MCSLFSFKLASLQCKDILLLTLSLCDLAKPTLLKASTSVSSSGSKILDNFVGMGFSAKMVADVIQEHGKCSIPFHLETKFLL